MAQIVLQLSAEKIEHERERYNFLNLIGDMGGVFEILLILFGSIASPVSEYSFIAKAISKLYLSRTTNEDLFEKPALKNSRNKSKIKNFKVPTPSQFH